MHLKLRKPTSKLILGSVLALLVSVPAASAFDLSFLNQIFSVVESTLGVSQGQWSQDALGVIQAIKDILAGKLPSGGGWETLPPILGGDFPTGPLGLPDSSQVGKQTDPNAPTNPNSSQQGTAAGVLNKPQTPEQSYVSHTRRESLTSTQVQGYTNTVLGAAGQKRTENQLTQSESYRSASADALRAITQQSQDSAQQAQLAETESAQADKTASEAQSDTESLAVLKKAALIQSNIAALGYNQSGQLSAASNQASIQSGQLHAIAGGQSISNQLLGDLKIGQAYQMMEATNTTQAIMQLNQADKNERRAQTQNTVDSIDLYYIPGLVPNISGGTP